MNILRILFCSATMVSATMAFAQPPPTLINNFSGGVTAVNHPYTGTPPTTTPNGVSGTWYDITSDAAATPLAGTLSSSPALRIIDGGFTNGVYVIYDNFVPYNSIWKVRVKWAVQEDATQVNGIRAYQMGVQVNGSHRVGSTSPNDLSVPTTAVATYGGTLTTTVAEDHTASPFTNETGTFSANAGDDLTIAFSTEIGPDFDFNSGTWGANASVFVDDLELVDTVVPVSMSEFLVE